MKPLWKVQNLSMLLEKLYMQCSLLMISRNCIFSSQRSKSLQELKHKEFYG